MIMVRFGEREKQQKKVLCCKEKTIQIWDINVDNIVISKLIETKTNSKYFIGMKFGKAIRPLVLIIPKMDGYVQNLDLKKDTIN